MKMSPEQGDSRQIYLPELRALEECFAIGNFTIENLENMSLKISPDALNYLFYNTKKQTYNVTGYGLNWIDVNQDESEFVDNDSEKN